jgi:DNA-directed RNA polymerase alpha subunit
MMKKEEIVTELVNSVDRNGLVTTLYGVFGKSVKVSVPFSQKACDMSVDDIDFSPRANNSLKRAGVFTIGEIIDLIADDGLLRIRNLGKKTQNEIKTRILAFGYERLTEAERKRFFYDIVERNCVAN